MAVYSMNEKYNLNENAIECKVEPCMEGAMTIIAESEANYASIMKAVGISELAIFESTGQEMIYEGADIKGFFGKMKQFFLNMLAKIKGLFQKFFAMIDGYVKSDKEFVNKYKKQLSLVNTKDFEYKGFKFTTGAVNLAILQSGMESVVGAIKDPANIPAADVIEARIKEFEDESDVVEKMRGKLTSDSSLTSAEFNKELFSKLRNGEDSKITLDKISAMDQLNIVTGTKTSRKDAEKAFKDLNDVIKTVIKSLERAEKDIYSAAKSNLDDEVSKKIRYVNTCIKFVKHEQTILQTANGAILSAIKAENRQAKAICTSLLNYKPKNEGFGYDDGDSFIGENFLAGVKLI